MRICFTEQRQFCLNLQRKCGTIKTDAEKFLWKQLSNKQLCGLRFRRQHPVNYFIADFYCHQVKLIIEVDGGYHKLAEQYEYDANRDVELAKFGLKVLRFSNDEILYDIENTLMRIEKEINILLNKNNEKVL